MACPYCGSKTLIIESDAVMLGRIRTTAQKGVELEESEQLCKREWSWKNQIC